MIVAVVRETVQTYFAGLEDRIVLDKQRSLGDNLREVLAATCRPEAEGGQEVSKRPGYMEAMVRLLQKTEAGVIEDER